MVAIIFKNGQYNGIDRELTIGELSVELHAFPYYLEKRVDGELVTFSTKPFLFSLEDVREYKRVMSTSDTFFYNSVMVKPTVDCKTIVGKQGVHLSTDGFIIEPEGVISLSVKMEESVNFSRLKLEGSYIKDLSIVASTKNDSVIKMNNNREFITTKPYDTINIEIHNPTDKVILLSECIFLY